MEKSKIKKAIVEAVVTELELQSDNFDRFQSHKDWDLKFVAHARKMNQLMIQYSVANTPLKQNTRKLSKYKQIILEEVNNYFNELFGKTQLRSKV